MMFFTADTHFGHENIIKYCDRPFINADEMDRIMMRRWNNVVTPRDTVYHLGDFMRNARHPASWYLNQLNGRIFLIQGNHDAYQEFPEKRFVQITPYLEIRYKKQRLVLCHYPMRSWNGMQKNTWMIHGHCHGQMPPMRHSIDVGVDTHDFIPYDFPELLHAIHKTEKIKSYNHR